MAAAVHRESTTIWEGDVRSGGGKVTGGTGAFTDLGVSLPTRAGDPNGNTSSEELIAAAHSGCYAMALSAALTQAGTPPERLEVRSVVGLGEKQGGGYEVTDSQLSVVGTVPGLSDGEFVEAARNAEMACPVSNALRGNIEITLDAKLST